MKGTVFIKDRKVILTVGETGKVPEITIELISPQFVFDGESVRIVEGVLDTIKK